MTTIYTPDDVITTVSGFEGEDFSMLEAVEDLLSPTYTDEQMDNLIALVVLDDGRVFYHDKSDRDSGYTTDILSMTGPRQGEFEAIIDTHRLNIITCQSDLPPFLFDLALTPTTVLPTGAEVCAPEVSA